MKLAKLLLVDPHVLILDEPTNHLDLPSLIWVEKSPQYLSWHPDFCLSRSEPQIDSPTVTISLEAGALVTSQGNYDTFLTKQKQAIETALRTRQNLEKRVADLEDFVRRFGSKATKAAAAQSKRKLIEKIREEISSIPVFHKSHSIHFKLPAPPPSNRIAFSIEGGKIGYPGQTLSSEIDLAIEDGDKVAIIGANGVGKSTLLKTMIGKIQSLSGVFKAAPRGVLAYFAQDQLDSLDASQDILTNIKRKSQLGDGELRKILGGFLFQGDDVYKNVGVFVRREEPCWTGLCAGAKANILFLDELHQPFRYGKHRLPCRGLKNSFRAQSAL